MTLLVISISFRAYTQDAPRIVLGLSNQFVRLSISGRIDRGCTLQSSTNLLHWQFVTNFAFIVSPVLIFEPATPAIGQVFYRALSQQVPSNLGTTNMVWIPPGTFTMGSPDNEPQRTDWEGPQTLVTISRGFWMGKYEVTQGEFASVMGHDLSWFISATGYGTDLSRPEEEVTWNDAVAYCERLTTRESNAGRLPDGYVYRLPTEAEWEYACRAGSTAAFNYGPALRSGMANFYGSGEYDQSAGTVYNPNGIHMGKTASVGSYTPNAWGLYDMHGNVGEWCRDWFSPSLPGGSVCDPQGPAFGQVRVFRGGSWNDYASKCRSSSRSFNYPEIWMTSVGFRVVLATP